MDRDAEDKDGNTMLHLAARVGLINIVKDLLKSTIDPNGVNNRQLTPLHCAAGIDNNEVIRILHESSASLNAQDKEGLTPLNLAALKGLTGTVTALIRLGANINIKA